MEQYGWLTRSVQLSLIILHKIFFLTAVKTRISFRFYVPEGQYKLYLECKILRFPKNGSYMHTTIASRPKPASSAEILHSYPLPQFCCTNNINFIYLWSQGFCYLHGGKVMVFSWRESDGLYMGGRVIDQG